jgi:hypothetical protein
MPLPPAAISLVADWDGDFLEVPFTVKHTPVWLDTPKFGFPRLVKCLKTDIISQQIW